MIPVKLDIRERLKDPVPLIYDGSYTTSLYDKGFYINRSFEELSVTEPQSVHEITQGFKRAGASLLRTNTFNAVLPKLQDHGLQNQLEEMIQASVKITSEVADEEAYVMGSLGPLGVILEPLGPTSYKEAIEYYLKNVEVFEKASVDAYSLEAFHDLNEMKAAIVAIQKVSDKAIFAHMGIQERMRSSFGHSLEEFALITEQLNVDVIGFAGEVGPSGMLNGLERLRPLTKKPISCLPNAGLPRYVNDQYIYLCNPDYIGKFAKRMIQGGAQIVGGHSGVYESHIKAITNSVKVAASFQKKAKSPMMLTIDTPSCQAVPVEQRSRLGKALKEGKTVISVEILPPQGVNCEKFFKTCQSLQEGGVQFVNIPDGARAVARMSSLQISSYIKQHFGLEPIPHLTTRDRNLIGLQGDLLGAYVNGVRNILIVTGDPPKLGNCPGATAVYDVDAIGLTHIASRLNQGLDLGGSSFGKPTEFLLGVALNPTAKNRELEIKRFKYKCEAGANFAITQPIYCIDSYKRFLDEVGPVPIPVIMGIWPLVSLRNAEFLKNEVPGVNVPDEIIKEMAKTGDSKEEALKRGMDIAIRTMDQAKDIVAGFQVSAPFNRVGVALKVIQSHGESQYQEAWAAEVDAKSRLSLLSESCEGLMKKLAETP